MIVCQDNLELLKTLEENSVDLIYCDILYGTDRDFKEYQDLPTDRKVVDEFYLPRIKEMHRVIKSSGSIYLQMDTKISHWVREMLDSVFGFNNFRNQITWKREGSKGAKSKSKSFPKNHDIILFYSKTKDYYYQQQFTSYSAAYKKKHVKIDEEGREFIDCPLGTRTALRSIEELKEDGRIYTTRKGGYRYKKFLYELEGVAVGDIWDDINPVNSMSKEKTGYPTQKPLELMERIISSSSKEGDLVADFFCGSGSFLLQAKFMNRKFIGCDLSEIAVQISKERINK